MFLLLPLLFVGIITPAGVSRDCTYHNLDTDLVTVSVGRSEYDLAASDVIQWPTTEYATAFEGRDLVPETNCTNENGCRHLIPLCYRSLWSLGLAYIVLRTESEWRLDWIITSIPIANDILNLTDTPRVNLDTNKYMNPYHSIANRMSLLLWAEQGAAEMEEFLQIVEDGAFDVLQRKISDQITAITKKIASASNHTIIHKHLYTMYQEFTKLLELVKNEKYEELHRLLLIKKQKTLQVRKFLATIEQLSPRELAEVFRYNMATKQQAQQVEKQIERIHQIKEREGATILRRTRQEADDEKLEEVRLLLMLLVLWFILCYCSEGTLWYVDIELTFGLSLVLSRIILLLGGDIEKNPGPLTEKELAEVEDKCLTEDDHLSIYRAISSMLAGQWQQLGFHLGLRYSKLDEIQENHPRDVKVCLMESLHAWLSRKFNYKRYGQPTWRQLVGAVNEINGALAEELASKHPVYVVPAEEQSSKASLHHNRSSDFSFMFRKVSKCLSEKHLLNVKELQEYLDFYPHPDERKCCRYVKRKVYEGAKSTRAILVALFPKYITATGIDLLQCIVENYGCRKCQRRLKKYAKKHLST